MKKNILFPALLLMMAIMVSCQSEPPKANFIDIKYTGCNIPGNHISERDMSGRYMPEKEQPDGLTYTISGDSLNMTVGINYICCAKFKATQKVEGNEITLMIKETTKSPSEYCKCMCYYTFDFYYNNLSEDNYTVNVVFKALDSSDNKTFTEEINVR